MTKKIDTNNDKNSSSRRVLIISGPTASGKSQIAEEIARQSDVSIISADSRQIYTHLNIGTAKPSQFGSIKYHLIDFLHPTEKYSANRFITDANKILNSEKTIISGGTGFYIRALSQGIFSGEFKSEELRAELNEVTSYELHKRLQKVDAIAAKGIHPNNKVRVIRALEVFLISGKAISQHWQESRDNRSNHKFYKIGIHHERDNLRARIRTRTEKMIEMGWINEVRSLLEEGIDTKCPGMQSLGYPLIIDHINGLISKDVLIEKIFLDTWHYARKQIVWLKKEPNLTWVNWDKNIQKIIEEIG